MHTSQSVGSQRSQHFENACAGPQLSLHLSRFQETSEVMCLKIQDSTTRLGLVCVGAGLNTSVSRWRGGAGGRGCGSRVLEDSGRGGLGGRFASSYATPRYLKHKHSPFNTKNLPVCCVCVCVCVCVLYIYTHTHTHTHTYMFIYIYIYANTCLSSSNNLTVFWLYIHTCISVMSHATSQLAATSCN